MIGIYRITNKINNKSYIGKSNNIKRRFAEHKIINHETNQSLKKAYIKYGLENFTFEILEECDLDSLNDREIYYIKTLKPEYNRTKGGDGASGHQVSEKTREILRQKAKAQWERLTEEQKQEIINKQLIGNRKGVKRPSRSLSEETKRKLREANLGKKQSKEIIEKRKQTILEKKKNGYIQTNQSHKKPVYCVETGETFESVKEASEKYNLTTLVGHLKGKYKTCKGKHYKYCSVTTNRDECSGVE